MTAISKQELVHILKKHGWHPIRQEGSHQIYRHETTGKQERVALGAGYDMGGGGLKELLERFGIVPNGRSLSVAEGLEVAKKKQRGGDHGKGGGGAAPGTFGARLFEARVAKGWSQSELVKRIGLGLTQVTVSGWERGNSSPFSSTGEVQFAKQRPRVAALALVFGWTDILAKTGPAPTAASRERGKFEITPVRELSNQIGKEIDREYLSSQETDLERELDAIRRKHSDEKAFAKFLLKSLSLTDIMQWMIDQSNQLRRVTAERDKLLREDTREMRRKAARFDAIRQDAENLLQKMREEDQ